MAKKSEPVPPNDMPRGFSSKERVKIREESPQTDIFEQVLQGKAVSKEEEADEQENDAMTEEEETGDEEKEEESPPEDEEEDRETMEIEEQPKRTRKKTGQAKKGRDKKSDYVEGPSGNEEIIKEDQSPTQEDAQNDEGKEEEQLEEQEQEGTAEFETDIEKEAGTREEGIHEEEQSKEGIRQTIMHKATLLSSKDTGEKESLPLKFLEDEKTHNVFIGRKKSVFKQYGYDAALLLGKVNEPEHKGKHVYLDGLNPHVVFICGARGSGKSYALGIIAEELALKNRNVGTILIDPIGVFWSMRFPNKEKKEIEKLHEWNLKTRGLENMKVFIPEGMTSSVPSTTFDKGFAIRPSLLTGEDWSLTFSIDRFSVTGLLLEQAIKKTEKGYRELETGKKIPAKGKNYSLEDIIHCLRTDLELNSRETGYKQDSIRALASRFEAAKNWGIFNEKGTPLGELSREGQLTILDTSFLDDNVTALVIGVLARRLLAARKLSTRKEAAQKFKTIDVDELLELEVPPTWLIVDEAHTLIPSGNEKTPASSPLVEYAKQGRRPGCSLVFATQQPSAIDTKVLSQLDIILTHKLVFDDDVKAVNKRTPTIIPAKYRKSSFIKTLPVGVAMVGDRREETSRAFVMEVRPRFSQHEGRDVETTESKRDLSPQKARLMALELLHKDVLKEGQLEIEKIENVIELMNAKYSAGLNVDEILDGLKERGLFVGEDTVSAEEIPVQQKEEASGEQENEKDKGREEGDETNELTEKFNDTKKAVDEIGNISQTELLALPQRIDRQKAQQIAGGVKKRKVLGLFGEEEKIESLQLKYNPIWKVRFDVISRSGKEFLSRECFIDSTAGEFIHFSGNQFVQSKGLSELFELGDETFTTLMLLNKSGHTMEELIAKTRFEEGKVHRILSKLHEKNLIGAIVEKNGKRIYGLKEKLDLPPSERHEMLGSLNQLPFVRAQVLNREREMFPKNKVVQTLQKLWKNIVVKNISEIYRPVWVATLSLRNTPRKVVIDAVTGKVL